MQYFSFRFGECYIYNLSVYVAVIIFVSNSTPKSLLLHNHLENILQSNVKEREQIQIQSTIVTLNNYQRHFCYKLWAKISGFIHPHSQQGFDIKKW